MVSQNEIKISQEYLKEAIDYVSSALAGKLLKRFEIISDTNLLKSIAKELIYEHFRYLRDLLIAYNRGYELSVFKFKTPSNKNSA